ncbi:type I DNA topoisomerase [Candidatus Dojkabacteria bacterium]|nr:type I DNA topoisomerase [Candidatus Dojkabacteria bacterium]
MKKLVIVESPSKAKTIEKYLGKDYKVYATKGHVMDLPKSDLGVDIEKNYEPKYEVIHGKKKLIKELKKLLPQNEQDVYLALDLDREGEAIADHVARSLKLENPNRIIFSEITKDAILSAIKNPRLIDTNLVNAQKARRVLDRLVGYKLSGLLWKKIWYGLSAGRVQSVATRLIVERERERDSFVPEEFWDIVAILAKSKSENPFPAKLVKKDDKKYTVVNESDAKSVKEFLKSADWHVSEVEKKERNQKSTPPFVTSTLQQAANNKLGFTAKRTMQIAQNLYQGVNIKGIGQTGLITYMRTDSTSISMIAIKSIRKFIKSNFGDKYLPDKPNFYKTKSRLAQEAHEAIRPTDIELTPEKLKSLLKDDQYKLYKLIWDKTLACQMSPIIYNDNKIFIEARKSDKDSFYTFNLVGKEILFDGFSRIYPVYLTNVSDKEQNDVFVDLEKGDKLICNDITLDQKFTKPRARFTEASLVKVLEKYGIGRPSTYATIISTIQARGYVKKDGRFLYPTDTGCVVNDFLVKYFSRIVDYDFTSEVEEDLDDVATKGDDWTIVVDKVYSPLQKEIDEKEKSVDKEDVVILSDSDEKCPECGGKMVVRLGRNGKFLSCASFPKCKGMLGLDDEEFQAKIDSGFYTKPDKCEKCGSPMELKSGKFGRFWACSNYPECKTTIPLLLGEKCPECGKNLVERKGRWGKSFIGCSGYPDCKYIKKDK